MFLIDVLCSGLQSFGLFFSVVFSSGRNVDVICAKYLLRWCIEPIKLFKCIKIFGGESFSIASNLLIWCSALTVYSVP